MKSTITIYLNEKAYEAILHEQKIFNTGNAISPLIKRIIINYYTKYEKNISELKDTIKNAIIIETNNQRFNNEQYLNIAWKITKYLSEESMITPNKKRTKKRKINIRINKNDFDFENITSNNPPESDCSDFLCNIVYAYLKEPQYERERILYKDIVDSINKAIANKQSIKIYTKAEKTHRIEPKEICTSQEGLYNYLIYQRYNEKNKKYYANTIHIHNIKNVQPSHNLSKIQPEIDARLDRMKCNGVQFSIDDDTIYKVKLTDRGKNLFKHRYLERPIPLPESSEKEGIYYFDCSKMQFKSYFAPFRENVIILEPQEIINEIIEECKQIQENHEKHKTSK